MPHQPHLCGQPVQKPGPIKTAYLLLVSLQLAAVVALTGYTIYTNANDDDDDADTDSRRDNLAYAVATLVATLAVWYFVLHGVLFERRLEVMFYCIASLFSALFVIYQYVTQQHDARQGSAHGPPIARLVVACVAQPINIVGGVVIIRYMDWLAFHLVGADQRLQQAYYVETHFQSLLKLDFVVGACLVVLAAFSGPLSRVERDVSIAGLGVTLFWVAWASVMAKEEQRWMVPAFVVVGLAEPAFIIYKAYQMGTHWAKYGNLVTFPVIVLSALALLVRIIIFVYGVRVYKNFGLGLRNTYHKLHNSQRSHAARSEAGGGQAEAGPVSGAAATKITGSTNGEDSSDEDDVSLSESQAATERAKLLRSQSTQGTYGSAHGPVAPSSSSPA